MLGGGGAGNPFSFHQKQSQCSHLLLLASNSLWLFSGLDFIMLPSLFFHQEGTGLSPGSTVLEQENENETVSTLLRGPKLALWTESMSVHGMQRSPGLALVSRDQPR